MKFENKQLILAGKFKAGDKGVIVKQMIEMAGGNVKENLTVSKETAYVVLGAKGSSTWKNKKCPQAIEAEKRQKKGQDITVVSEETLFSALSSEGVTKDKWSIEYKELLSKGFDQIEKATKEIDWVLDSSSHTLLIENDHLPDLLGMLEDAQITGFRFPIPSKDERAQSWKQSTEAIIGDDSEGDIRASEYSPEDLVKILPWGPRIGEIERIVAPKLTEVPPALFAWTKELKEAELPVVRVIRNGAFYECTSLETIKMPEVVFIGSGSFCQCRSLSCKLVLSRLESLGATAFSNCEKLPSFTTASEGRKRADGKEVQGTGYTIRNIGNFAFINCNNLKSVGFSKEDILLGKECFHRCESLPDDIRALGDEAFAKELAEKQ